MITLMCVDDDPDIQILYERILRRRDYNLRIYGSGNDAIRSFMREPVDLILLDLDMPGLTGMETCSELKKLPRGAHVPIIFVSSNCSEETIMEALASGADDYILKPFKPSELLAKLNHAIKRHRAGIEPTPLSYSNRYEIITKIDDGGQTSVYHALDKSVDPHREVALKIFKPADSHSEDSQFKTLFLREAYEWSKLDHPNIVKLHDFGQASGSYYLVLEFVRGTNLWNRVDCEGALEDSTLQFVALQLVLALEHMSTYNIVHRDIKPNNILISGTGDVKVTDFGLAKQQHDSKITIMSNVFKGTPDFVSPEQIQGENEIDIQSDVYSLGVTLYYAATGELPFRGASIIETLNNHFSVTPMPVIKVNSAISSDMSAVIDGMMGRDKADRIPIQVLKDRLANIRG